VRAFILNESKSMIDIEKLAQEIVHHRYNGSSCIYDEHTVTIEAAPTVGDMLDFKPFVELSRVKSKLTTAHLAMQHANTEV